MGCRLVFAKDYLDLQVTFAERVRSLSEVPLERALLEYTNLYVRFGLGREFDAEHADWRTYLCGLRTANDVREYTYEFYLTKADATTAPPIAGRFGYFAWGCEERGTIRLHFLNDEQRDASPLSNQQRDARRAELTALFAHARSHVGDSARVVGISWLHNLEAYRRLFPPAYANSRRFVRTRLRGMALWGQFLNYRGQLRQKESSQFLDALAQQSSICGIEQCFPFQVLTTEAPIQQFCSFYGL